MLAGMAPAQGWARRYIKAFCKGFFVAVPVAVTFLDRVACVARVEGASMQVTDDPSSPHTRHNSLTHPGPASPGHFWAGTERLRKTLK